MDATQLQKNNEKFAICSNMDDLEDIMLSEISQRKKNTVWYDLYVEAKQYNKLVNITKSSWLTGTENKLVVTSGEGGGLGGKNYWV